MRSIPAALTLVTAFAMVPGAPLRAQSASDAETRSRLTTLVVEAPGTPGGKGLLPLAVAEARTALRQAVLAEKAPDDLKAMRQYGAAILHAVDPSLQSVGPGLGYGVRRAVGELLAQIDAIAVADRQADVARMTPRALTAARDVQQLIDTLVGVAQRLTVAQTLSEASGLSRQAREVASEILAGANATPTRPRSTVIGGGLFAVQASLAPLIVRREGTLPATLRKVPEPRR